MKIDSWKRTTLLIALCACIGGCDEPSDTEPAAPAAGTDAGSPSAPPPPGPASDNGGGNEAAITASLKSGDYFEFLATSASSATSPSTTSTSSDHGTFRLTLGAPATVGGVDGFAVTVSGKTLVGGHEFTPAWTFVAQYGARWLGSNDGATLVPLYDPALPSGTRGFFLDMPESRRITAHADVFEGAYNRYAALALGDSRSDGGCELVLSYTICSDSATSFSQREYLKDGIGPIGFSRRMGYTAGGSAPSVVNASLDLELIATSLAARDGSVVNAPPWRQATSMPVSRSGATAAAIGNRIYVFGGTSDSPDFSDERVDVLDTSTGVWSRGSDAPRSLSGSRSVAIGDRIAVLFGSDGLLHDPATGLWTPMARLTASGTLAGVGARTRADGTSEIVVIVDPGVAYLQGTLHRYSVAANTWSVIGNFDKGQRANYTAVVAGKTFFLVGGFGNGRYIASSLAVDLDTLAARNIPTPIAAIDSAAAFLADKLYVAGGYNFGGASRGVYTIDTPTGTVSAGPSMLGGLYDAATAVVDGRIYVLGGTSSGRGTDGVVVFTP
jgi:Kelch motif